MFKSRKISVPFVIALATAVTLLTLAVTGKLTLYVHPRYTVFTVTMAAIAFVLLLCAAFFAPAAGKLTADPAHAAHESTCGCESGCTDASTNGCANGHADGCTDSCTDSCADHGTKSQRRRWAQLANTAALLILVPLVLLPTATLSPERARLGAQGGLAQLTGFQNPKTTASSAANAADRNLGEWAALVASSTNATELAGETAQLSGFITATLNPDVLLLNRYLLTCCAVDAQPISVPVYLPDWQKKYEVGSWVQATGFFIDNPQTGHIPRVLLHPTAHTSIEPPSNPYLAGG